MTTLLYRVLYYSDITGEWHEYPYTQGNTTGWQIRWIAGWGIKWRVSLPVLGI
jgi:hypothetical protein